MRDDANPDRTDEQIRSELIRYLDQLPVEGKEEVWLRIQQEVYSTRRSVSRKKIQLSMAAAFIFALLLLFQTPVVSAWGRDLLDTVLVRMPGPLRNLVMNFIPNPRDDMPLDIDPKDQMEKLFSSVPYKPLVVKESNQTWKLTGVGVKSNTTGVEVTLEYEKSADTVLTLREEAVDGPLSSATFYDADDTTVTEVAIRGISIHILTHRTGIVNAWWIEQGIALHLTGRSNASEAAEFIDALVPYATKR